MEYKLPVKSSVKNRIIEYAKGRFFRSGFLKSTMDELSSGLGISKKTLYEHFSSKEELLWAVVNSHLSETGDKIDTILFKTDIDFLTKLKDLMVTLGTQISKVGRPFFQDVRKNAPDIWKKIDAFRHEKIISKFGQIFDEGVKKGIFRDDINPQLLLMIYTNTIENTLNPETLDQIPFMASEVFESVIKIIFEGALTDNAKAIYSAIGRRTQEIK